MSANKDTSARSQLLKVTTELLYTREPEEVTVREIASRAGVNVAVLAATAAAFDQGLAVLTDKAVKPRERLIGFFDGYAKGLVKFKGITRTAFRNLILRSQGSDHYADFLKRLLEATAEVIRELGQRPEKAGKKALALFSGVAFPFLAQKSLRNVSITDYSDAASRREYVRFLVETVMEGKERQ